MGTSWLHILRLVRILDRHTLQHPQCGGSGESSALLAFVFGDTCGGLNEKYAPLAHVFEYLVSSWYCLREVTEPLGALLLE